MIVFFSEGAIIAAIIAVILIALGAGYTISELIWVVFDYILKYWWLFLIAYIIKTIFEYVFIKKRKAFQLAKGEKFNLTKCVIWDIISNVVEFITVLIFSHNISEIKADHPIMTIVYLLTFAIIFAFSTIISFISTIDYDDSESKCVERSVFNTIAFSFILIACLVNGLFLKFLLMIFGAAVLLFD